MSRFLPGKRKQTDNSPEKSKGGRRPSSIIAESSSSGSLQLLDGSNGHANGALAGAPLSPQRSNLLKKLPSVGDIRHAANGNRRSSIVFDPSTQIVHSRSGNFSLDEQTTALSRQGTRGSTSNRRSTYSTHSNNGVLDSQSRTPEGSSGLKLSESVPSPRTASISSMTNPALALDTKVSSFSSADMDTPRPRYEDLEAPSSNVKLFVSDGTSNKENEHAQYPPVFDTSDVGTSSSSSSNSPALGTADSASSTGYFSRPKIQVRHTNSSGNLQTARNSHIGPATLAPASAATDRPRSGSTGSVVSDGSHKESKSPGIRLRKPSSNKKGRSNSALAAALAASGMSLPAPAAATSQPMKPVPQLSTDSYTSSGAHSSGSKQNRPGPLLSRSSEEGPSGYDSPTPLSNYTPNDSPKYEDDAYQAMVTMDAIRDFDDVMSQLGAGYALASSKRNADFHGVFKTVPEEDYLIEDYGCALQREILIQGRLYISEHHLSFHANIFGWITNVVLSFNEIVAIEKRNTALVIPNAIHIATIHSRHTFASFISRDTTYELITSLWRNQHPVFPPSAALPEAALTDEEDDLAAGTQDDGEGGNQKRKKKKMKDRFKKSKAGASSAMETRESEDNVANGPVQTASGDSTVLHSLNGRPSLGAGQLNKKSPVHPPSTCTCGPSAAIGPHLVTEIMDTTFPGSPEKIYNLIFTSGFMVDFFTTDMKLTDLQLGDWAPQKTGSHLLTRSYSYIKPLNAPVGPKSAKCILVDENLHVDFDDFVVTATTTRTPEVPSGGSFSVKTKTCIMWGKNNTTRVLVTSAMDWTGRSFIRGIIDKSSMDGQRALYVSLEKAMRAYISQHKSEFYLGGEDTAIDNGDHEFDHTENTAGPVETAANGSNVTETGPSTILQEQKLRSRPLLDYLSGAVPILKPLTDFLATLVDTIIDFTGQMSVTALVCSAVIFVLVVSNLFTLSSLREKSSRYVPTRRPPPNYSNSKLPCALAVQTEGEQYEVAQAVRGVLQEYFDSQKRSSGLGQAGLLNKQEASLTPKEELADIRAMLDSIDERVRTLRATLAELD